MVEEQWCTELPEIFEREKNILESKGFFLNKVKDSPIEFVGKSSVLKEYPLRIIYPDGYPSFPPSVISDVNDDLVLVRHQFKLSKVLCLFGFSSERWRANFTAREVLQEAEELIANYSPLTYDKDSDSADDIVPEPIINQFNYEPGGILIPAPFGDLSLGELEDSNEGKLKYPNGKVKRGMLSSLKVAGENKEVDLGYDNWLKNSTIYKTQIYKIDSPPPLTTVKIKPWLKEKKIRVNPKKNQFVFFVFEDEWGKRGNKRTSWIALKLIQGEASWLRCYLVSEDDVKIRTPYGSGMSDKAVTLIGAGSLGSLVSTTLAQEGVGDFYIVDHDIYEPSNSIRHQVRQDYFALPKVDGVADRILELKPKTNITLYRMAIGSSKSQEDYQHIINAIKKSDVVIDTTGEHSVSHLLNRVCVKYGIPLVVGSVTNGAWSCEVVKYIPGYSGCWGCWNRKYGSIPPPGAPKREMQFAPGCDQPTFVGGISSVNISGGLISEAVIDTLNNEGIDKNHYILWSERDQDGNRQYKVDYLENPALKDCVVCNDN
jgi:hypothetical protein